MLLHALKDNFKKINPKIATGVLLVSEAMMKCSGANTSKICRELSIMNKKSFKTNDMWLYRFLNHKNFQLDDNFWRCYIKSIFQILVEQDQIQKDEKILINVDFTSDRDDFLILCASVMLGANAIPIYFSMRNYPKRKNQYNHKKMELAFIKALKHALSSKYQYIIVADRGFGNDRFAHLCINNGFDVMLRLVPNMNIKSATKEGVMEKILTKDGVYNCHIKSWEKDYNIIRHSKDDKTWYLLTNIVTNSGLECASVYAKRFRIEKLFQNLKSNGFDIEKSKIKKYDRFKRLLFLSCFAQSMLVLIGKFVNDKMPDIKKNLPISTNLLIASSSLENLPLAYTQKKRAMY